MTDLLYFEDFKAGQSFAFGDYTPTEEEIVAFARQFDPQPQHLDKEAAKHGLFGGLVASGWHTCAIAMRMISDGLYSRCAALGSPGVETVQWRRPVRPGDRLRMEARVLRTRESKSMPDRGFVTFEFDMLRGEERVMLWLTSVMFAKRGRADVV